MRTAIIKTDFWKDDSIFDLSIDARMLYLCLLTNPERDTTPAFKCSDRLLVAYTGFNEKQIDVARNNLVKNEKIKFIKKFYIIENQDFVDTKRGKLTAEKYKKDFYNLPVEVQRIVLKNKGFCSRATLDKVKSIEIEIVKEIEIEKEKEKGKAKFSTLGAEIIKLFETVNINCKRYYNNTSQREASDFLIKEFGFEKVKKIIKTVLPKIKELEYFPTITTPCHLRDKWASLETAMRRQQSKQTAEQKKRGNVYL